MTRDHYRYQFKANAPFDEVTATLDLSLIAVESIRGEPRALLDARSTSDPLRRTIEIDASTETGQLFNEIFAGYAAREFGIGGFIVELMRDPQSAAFSRNPR